MAIFRIERLLAGTAIAIALTAAGPAAHAQTDTPTTSAIESKVPVPEQADITPPSQRDVGETTASTPQIMNAPAVTPAPAQQKSAETKPLESKPMESQAVDTKPAVEAPKAAETKPVEAKPAEAAKPVEAAKTPEVKPQNTASADAVTEKLRDLFAAKSDRMFLKTGDRSGAEAFYSARKFAPIWTSNAGANDRAKAAVAYLSKVDADGLDPADYPIPSFKAGMDAAALADAEAKLTASVLAYARHAQTGRIAFSRVSADIVYNPEAPEAKDVLGKLSDAKNVEGVLASYEPQHPQYKALKAQLAKARGVKAEAAPVRIGAGPTLKLGKTAMTDPRVPQLRERLGVAAKAGDTTYDKDLSEAVAKFQKANNIKPDGNLGAATITAMNGPKREHLADTIVANLERWRWVPRDLGAKRVILNIPDYTLRVYNGEAQVWQTNVVTGKPGKHATPLLSETMKFITVNPTWNVPPSIVYGEYLPALQQDPTVLQRMGFKLTQAADGGIHIAQPPGDGNALGRIRFNFPNKFLVYQHDTPEKHLFARFPRAYSHGCMRVENPLKYGEMILSLANPKDGYSAEKLKSMYGPSEIDIKLQTHIPVHITYQTAFVDEGKLQTRDDVYGRDAAIIALLKGDRKILDVPVDNPQPNYSRPSVSLPPGVAGAYASNSGGGNFFEALFGGGNRQQVQDQPTTTRGGTTARRPVDRSLFSW